MIQRLGEMSNTHTRCSCNHVYCNLCITSLLWLRCGTMPTHTDTHTHTHTHKKKKKLCRIPIHSICTGKCCDSQEGLGVENDTPETSIYRLKAVVVHSQECMKMDECYDLRCVDFLPLFLAQTFVASLVSSAFFFGFPQNPCHPFTGSKRRGFGSMILPSGRWVKKAESQIERNEIIHFWLDSFWRKLKPFSIQWGMN